MKTKHVSSLLDHPKKAWLSKDKKEVIGSALFVIFILVFLFLS